MLEMFTTSPRAPNFFATSSAGITRFAQNIRALRARVATSLWMIGSISWRRLSRTGRLGPELGGIIIQAVNDVTADGALLFVGRQRRQHQRRHVRRLGGISWTAARRARRCRWAASIILAGKTSTC